MLDLAKKNIQENNIKNIKLHYSAAQDFDSGILYDTVLMSGLTIYLRDLDLASLLSRIYGYLRPNGRVVLRDGNSLLVLSAGRGIGLDGFHKLNLISRSTRETILTRYLRQISKEITIVTGYGKSSI